MISISIEYSLRMARGVPDDDFGRRNGPKTHYTILHYINPENSVKLFSIRESPNYQ
jgi:hypothetical protein